MNTAAAYKYDDTAPLPTATRLRLVTCAWQAANDRIYYLGSIQNHPLPNPLMELLAIRLSPQAGKSLVIPPAGEGANDARCADQALDAPLYRPTQVDMPEGRSVKYAYDLSGNKTLETDARNNATQFSYDRLNRLTGITDPMQQTLVYDYDAAGNKVRETDKRNNATTFGYDVLNRLTSVTDPLNQITRSTYDAVGNKLSDTDKRGITTAYSYDKANRLLSTTKAGVTLQTQQYDEVGNVKFKTDANNNTSAYIYDGRNLLLTASLPLAAITNYQ